MVFRLWLALSFVAVVCTTLAFGFYVWLSVRDDLNNAEEQTAAKVRVILASTSRIRFEDSSFPELPGYEAGNDLGVQVEIFDASGRLVGQQTFGNRHLVNQPLDPGIVRQLAEGGPGKADVLTQRTVRIEESSFRPVSLSPADVIAGGDFGEEHVISLSRIVPGQGGAIRVIAEYPHLTSNARTLIYRSIIAADLIILALVVCVWLLLRRFVSNPLRHYSGLAMRMAVGEAVRMPVNGRQDELSQLARAVNGMADALEYQSTVDALTGLYNLRHLSSHMEALIAQAKQTGQPLSVIFCDLDDLKPVNDTHGHEAGDLVLRAVGGAIHRWAGSEYTSWRLGGDEFVVALPNTSEAEALILSETLREAVASLVISVKAGQVIPSISLGISCYPEDGASAGTLLGIADRRMYGSKAQAEERRLQGTPAA
jgi:diguanylate cyclase (GGDEF)-like protein